MTFFTPRNSPNLYYLPSGLLHSLLYRSSSQIVKKVQTGCSKPLFWQSINLSITAMINRTITQRLLFSEQLSNLACDFFRLVQTNTVISMSASFITEPF